jgi:hypothetical protein
MNRKQKVALILFVSIDIIIIGLLVGTVISVSSRYRNSTLYYPGSQCAELFLHQLQDENRQVTFSLSDSQINITVSTQSEPDQDDGNLLWLLLDELKVIIPAARERCQYPDTLSIQVNITRENVTTQHTTFIKFQDLVDWSENQISDTALATQIKYHQVRASTD